MVVSVLALSLSQAPAQAADVAVVVHPGVPVNDLSFAEVRKIMLGDRQYWSPSLRITLIVRAPMAVERDILPLIRCTVRRSAPPVLDQQGARDEASKWPRIVYPTSKRPNPVGAISGVDYACGRGADSTG